MGNEMQEEQKPLRGIDVPDAKPSQDTFDLDAFIADKSTTPVVGVTVYLDAEGGRLLQKAMNQKAEAELALAGLETMPNPMLAVGEENPLLRSKVEAEEQRDKAQKQIDQLTERIISSALYIEFRYDHGAVVESQQNARESLPENADETMSARDLQKIFMVHAAASICIRITNVEQKVIEGPFTVERFNGLVSKLIEPESVKMFDAMNEALGVGQTWSEQLDAGFPGRSADLAS
jgi:hypothetical protein